MTACAISDSDPLYDIVDLDRYPIRSTDARSRRVRADARRMFQAGMCILDRFLTTDAVETLCAELDAVADRAYVSTTHSSVYLRPGDAAFPVGHPRHMEHVTRVGTLAEDQLPPHSLLRRLHGAADFRRFVAHVVGVKRLHGYADGLTSVNVVIFNQGDELGWHFDESDYAITLLLRSAAAGGVFEYLPNVRSADQENYPAVREALGGLATARATASLCAGSLMLFRGSRSLHRVTPICGLGPRMVAVLSYDERPGVCLSEHDRQLFYGRIA